MDPSAESSVLAPALQEEKKSRRWWPVVLYCLLPLAVFIFTSITGINKLSPLMALVCIALLMGLHFVPKKSRTLNIVLWSLTVLFLVGSSGWFYTPFFFALYLLALAYAFIYTPAVAISFTMMLIVMFALSEHENATYDLFTYLTLLSVIPVAIVLRKTFLLVQQEQKGILILESDKGSGITSLDSILNNQVNRVGVTLRQPITYLKQALAMLDEGKLSRQEEADVVGRMRKSAEELFTLVKEFERGATKNSFVGKKESVKTIKL